jgi:uncharacterized protein (TIGR00369 family)
MHLGITHGREAMQSRSGPFWAAVEGRAPLPPAAVTLGLEVIEVDGDNGVAVVAFTANESFTNPMGEVLGAFLAAMLYDTAGPALLATLRPDQFQATVQLNVNFLRPAVPGQFIGVGRVVHRSGDLALLEASLATSEDVLVATATATATVIPASQRGGAVC